MNTTSRGPGSGSGTSLTLRIDAKSSFSAYLSYTRALMVRLARMPIIWILRPAGAA